uniref:GATOR complex protein MIO zinc-ribbon like domain-containing protein n=1 Tax=Panagrolaimus sp. JU765 TaxID=591449 RepID=A0AC34QCH8_9BILA
MFPEFVWLRNNPRRFFIVENEKFVLFELDNDYKLGACEKSLPHKNDLEDSEHEEDILNNVPFEPMFELNFSKADPLRSASLSYLQDNTIALCFYNKIVFHRAYADPSIVPDDEMRLKKTPICVDWSPIDKHKFLCISERAHKDFNFSIYDLEKASSLGYDNTPRLLHWPVREKLTTAAFFPEDRDIIGLLSKEFIRIVDIRGREKHAAAIVQSNDGKPFVGFSIEPNIGYRFLTYRFDTKSSDNEIHIYDRRMLKRPVYIHSDYTYNKSCIRRCVWSPHQRFNIYCLTEDDNKINEFTTSPRAYDYGQVFKYSHTPPEEVNEIMDRSVSDHPYLHSNIGFPGIHKIRDFQWHPKHDNELALIVNKLHDDYRHIQLFKLNRNAYSVMGANNECAYVQKQFISVTESVIQHPVRSYKINFLENEQRNDKIAPPSPKEEVLPFRYSEGMYYFDNRQVHAPEACKISHCIDCLRGYMNTRVDENERREAEDRYFAKYWASISSEVISNMENCKKGLQSLLNGDDISVVMRQRVEAGYGYGAQARDPLGSLTVNCLTAIKNNPKLASSEIMFLWNWLERMSKINPKYNLESLYGHCYVGIDVIIDSVQSVSSQYDENCDWGTSRVFTNEKRQQMLQMCLWPEFGDAEGLKKICDRIILEKSVEAYIRAIFISLAACQGGLAKEYARKLKMGMDSKYSKQILSHKTRNKNFLKLVRQIIEQIEQFNGANLTKEIYDELCEIMSEIPVLLACVKYLARRLNYALIMWEIAQIQDIKIEDRIMFALINMDDKLLQQTFCRLHTEMLDNEPLKAFMFIGLYDCQATHRAILRYYENTNDCQTTSILYLIGHCFDNIPVLRHPANIGLRTEKLVEKLIYCQIPDDYRRGLNCFFDYIDILTRWNMFLEKTFLYNMLFNKNNQKGRIMRPQAVIACTYCGRAAYPCSTERIQNYKAKGREMPDNFPNRSRITTCAGCRKQLPKCVICRHHYGSIVDSMATLGENYASIDQSFVFCSHCHHGGHYIHIKEWFEQYNICPASSCDCHCSTRDGAAIDESVLRKAREISKRKVLKQNLTFAQKS